MAHAADQVSEELLARYTQLSQQAQALQESAGVEAAIELYEEALLGFAHSYGRVHLRLGQLYQSLDRVAESAAHFRDCLADERVDPLDRDLICAQGHERSTTPFHFEGLPPQGQVVVLSPELFAGPVRSGERLPIGELVVMVDALGHQPRRSALQLPQSAPWHVQLGASMAGQPGEPDYLSSARAVPEDFDPEAMGGVGTWPAWVTGAVGLAAVGAGLGLGFFNQSGLDEIRGDQRANRCAQHGYCADRLSQAQDLALTADILWISGAALSAGAVALYFWLAD